MDYDEAKVMLRLDTYLYPALREYYGSVPWLDNPKGNQDTEAIKRTWAKALQNASGDELMGVVTVLKKKKKSMTCPTLAHVLEALKQMPKAAPLPGREQDKESSGWTTPSDVVRSFVPCHKFYLTSDLNSIADDAMYKRVPQIIGEQAMREIELSYPGDPAKVRGVLMKKAVELHLFDDLESYGYKGYTIGG